MWDSNLYIAIIVTQGRMFYVPGSIIIAHGLAISLG